MRVGAAEAGDDDLSWSIWNTVSIGFESGSDRVLQMINKECSEEDNYFTIDLLTRIGDDLERQGKKPPVFWSNIMLGIPGETHEDAFKTMRMVKYTKRIMPSISFYAPYPGSALGNQLIAEGKNIRVNFHRSNARRWQILVTVFRQRSTTQTEHQDVFGRMHEQ